MIREESVWWIQTGGGNMNALPLTEKWWYGNQSHTSNLAKVTRALPVPCIIYIYTRSNSVLPACLITALLCRTDASLIFLKVMKIVAVWTTSCTVRSNCCSQSEAVTITDASGHTCQQVRTWQLWNWLPDYLNLYKNRHAYMGYTHTNRHTHTHTHTQLWTHTYQCHYTWLRLERLFLPRSSALYVHIKMNICSCAVHSFVS